MNYYPFHLGDYAAHTMHLSWEEDVLYRRLLDLYYLHEKAVPADVQKLARLIRMPKSVAVLEAVLAEFFVLEDDGWHNKRADKELAELAEKKDNASERDGHEKDRQKRYRERRAQMFAALRAVGIIPAFDVAMKELQHLHDTNCTVTSDVTGDVTKTSQARNGDVTGNASATAIPTPTPTPIPNKEIHTPRKAGPPAVAASEPLLTTKDLIAEGVDETVAADWMRVRKAKKAPLTPTAWDAVKREAAIAGLTPAQAVKTATENNWQGFKAVWLDGDRGKSAGGANDWTANAS